METAPGPLVADPVPWRRNAYALAAGSFCSTLGFSISWPFLPLIVQDLGIGDHVALWVGYLVGSYFLVSFAMTPVWGGLADHYGKRTMVLRAGFGMAGGFLLLPLVGDVRLFLLVFVVIGAFNGYVPAASALAATSTPGSHMGRALAIVQLGSMLGTTAGPALGALVAPLVPTHRDLFWISTAMTCTAGLIALAFTREVPSRREGPFRFHPWRDFQLCLRVPAMGVLLVISAVFSLTFFGSTTVASLYVMELMGGQALQWGYGVEFWVGMVNVALTVTSAAAALAWGRLLDRFEGSLVLGLALLAGALGSLPLPWVRDALQLTLARALMGALGVGIQPATIRLIRERSPAGMEARAMAFGTALQMLGNGAAPMAAGLIGPWLGLRAYFALNVALLVSALGLWAVRGLRRPPLQAEG